MNDNIEPLHGIVIVKTEQTMDIKTESGLYKDITYDVHRKMIIKGEVVATAKTGSPLAMFEIDPTLPKSREVPSEYYFNKQYHSPLQPGDIVYFHYLTLEDPNNFLRSEGYTKFYKVQLQDCFCYVRDSVIHMMNDYVLAKPYYGEGWEEVDALGTKVIAKMKAGLVVEIKDEGIENHATVSKLMPGLPTEDRWPEVPEGSVVYLTPNCEFENTIEGEEYWVFTHRDIIAKYDGKNYIPVHDYVMIELLDRQYEGPLVVDTDYLELRDEGRVVGMGMYAHGRELEIGDLVKYAKGSSTRTHILDKRYAFIRYEYIYFKVEENV